MSPSVRPRRSLLLVPADNARALQASENVVADGLIYDLTETVAPAAKSEARERLREHLAGSAFSGEKIVRINGLDTVWGTEDFLAARGANVDAILLPRVAEPSVVRQIVTALHETDAPDTLKLWAMIETPRGVLNAGAIAEEGAGRLAALIAGIATLKIVSGVRPDSTRTEISSWLSGIVLAAKAHDLDVIDGPFANVRDTIGFNAECAQGRRLGFDGKMLIHPNQIDETNTAFAPSTEAIAWARKVVDAFSTSPDIDQGVATLSGRTIDWLHLAEADRILKLTDAIAARSPTTTS